MIRIAAALQMPHVAPFVNGCGPSCADGFKKVFHLFDSRSALAASRRDQSETVLGAYSIALLSSKIINKTPMNPTSSVQDKSKNINSTEKITSIMRGSKVWWR